MTQFDLLKERRFLPFFVTQFLGAFNDNIFKNALVILVTFSYAQSLGLDANVLVNAAAGLFILPFFLFSATAGQFADKYEKSTLIQRIKLAEIAIMVLGSIGLLLGNLYILLGVLFLMGTQSSFFGPAKYAILPQHLHPNELVGGNALVEMGTFLAILLGTIAGGLLAGSGRLGVYAACVTVIGIALLGWRSARSIPKAEAVDPALRINWNVLTETVNILRNTYRNRTVFLSVIAISWFWFYGSLFLTQMPNYAKHVLHGDESVVTLLLATFSIGIGVGSLACERLAHKRIELGLVPFGAIGLSVFAFDLAFAHPAASSAAVLSAGEFLRISGSLRVLFDLGLIALFGGFFIVPLYALVQSRSEPGYRSRVIAGNNILNALGMVIAALMAATLLGAGLTIPQLFLVMSFMNVAVAFYVFSRVPEFTVRLIIWLLMHSVYRLQEERLECIPEQGAAVVVCNHVSFVDALVIMAATPRPVRFVMDHRIFNTPVLHYVFKHGGAIPIAGGHDDPTVLRQAYDQIAAALEQGELVGLFPEGKITHDGNMNEFKPGIEKIIARTPVPVVPLALCNLWGSFFSRHGGRAMWGLPRRLWSKVALVAAPPVPSAQVAAADLRRRVLELRGDRR